MTRIVRGAVVPVTHDLPKGEPPAPGIPSSADFDALFTTDRFSIARFWSESSHGHIVLRFTLTPTVSVTAASLIASPARVDQAALALEALKDAVNDKVLDGYDFALFYFHPGVWGGDTWSVNSAAGEIADNDRWLPFTVFGFHNRRDFVAHEVGHNLGLDDGIGLRTGVFQEGRRYGDPYDIMSAQTYGGRSPFHSVPPVAGWSRAEMEVVGPRLSAAGLYLVEPAALRGRVANRSLPTPGSPVSVRLLKSSVEAVRPTGSGDVAAIFLSSVGEPASREAIVVEYRSPVGFDAGLSPTYSSAQAHEGLTIHRVGPVEGWPTYLHRYVGVIHPDNPDTDVLLTMDGEVYAATLDGVAEGHIDFTLRHGAAPRSARIETGSLSETVHEPGYGVTTKRDECGNLIRRGTWDTSARATYEVTTSGLETSAFVDPATVTWRVAGRAVAQTSTDVHVAQGSRVCILTCTVEGAELVVASAPGDAVQVAVTVTVDDGNLDPLEAAAVFATSGTHSGVHPDDLPKVVRCIRVLMPHLPPPPPHKMRLEEPGWARHRLVREHEAWRAKVLRDLNRMGIDSATAIRVRAMTDLLRPF